MPYFQEDCEITVCRDFTFSSKINYIFHIHSAVQKQMLAEVLLSQLSPFLWYTLQALTQFPRNHNILFLKSLSIHRDHSPYQYTHTSYNSKKLKTDVGLLTAPGSRGKFICASLLSFTINYTYRLCFNIFKIQQHHNCAFAHACFRGGI